MNETAASPLVVGISGASGALLGVRALDACRELGVPTHLVVSRNAAQTIAQETRLDVAGVNARASVVHRAGDIGAAIASGSFPTRGMLIAPCSVRTMSEIATGVTASLMTRAADVTLKERRRLVLMVRETPLHLGHLRTLVQLAEMGAVIAPPVPAFYAAPLSLADIVDQSVGRALDLFGLAWKPVRRWGRDIGPVTPETREP
ncbi:MAG TPA: UbiX family flavin prenyltransferase [Caulobacteraceae bacterium]|nr:UbiX family flavin prenyltransferase [Caulobacteraceae bacterium]